MFVALGLVGIVSLALLVVEVDLGLGLGGIERMVFYPAMFWMIAFGTYRMTAEYSLVGERAPS